MNIIDAVHHKTFSDHSSVTINRPGSTGSRRYAMFVRATNHQEAGISVRFGNVQDAIRS